MGNPTLSLGQILNIMNPNLWIIGSTHSLLFCSASTSKTCDPHSVITPNTIDVSIYPILAIKVLSHHNWHFLQPNVFYLNASIPDYFMDMIRLSVTLIRFRVWLLNHISLFLLAKVHCPPWMIAMRDSGFNLISAIGLLDPTVPVHSHSILP